MWNVKVVLNFIKSNRRLGREFSLVELNFALAMPLVLTSTARASSIKHLHIKCMAVAKGQYKFYFNKLQKSKERKKLYSITYHEYILMMMSYALPMS